MNDLIRKQDALDAIDSWRREYPLDLQEPIDDCWNAVRELPAVQPTLYGYNIEHLILIAEALRKENLPPERAVEAMTDIRRIVSIIKDEFEESLRQETIHVISDWIYDTTDERLPETVIRSLPSVQPKTHWNPCSERLPEEGQKCLVCDKGGIGIDTYIGHGNPYNWEWYTRDYEAWQPLPNPYKGGDSE